MPPSPRPSAAGGDDRDDAHADSRDSAAEAFAAAASRAESVAHTAPDASAHELAAAREERTRRVLAFEASWAVHGGAKARAIRTEFGWSTTRYYQVLDGLLETTEALRHDPMLVRRLLRLRERR